MPFALWFKLKSFGEDGRSAIQFPNRFINEKQDGKQPQNPQIPGKSREK